ncbi:hypothetical protein LOTGIDRAFT_132816, partial [Lottia gigantea]
FVIVCYHNLRCFSVIFFLFCYCLLSQLTVFFCDIFLFCYCLLSQLTVFFCDIFFVLLLFVITTYGVFL